MRYEIVLQGEFMLEESEEYGKKKLVHIPKLTSWKLKDDETSIRYVKQETNQWQEINEENYTT